MWTALEYCKGILLYVSQGHADIQRNTPSLILGESMPTQSQNRHFVGSSWHEIKKNKEDWTVPYLSKQKCLHSATQGSLVSVSKFQLILNMDQILTLGWDWYCSFLCFSRKLALSSAFKKCRHSYIFQFHVIINLVMWNIIYLPF